MYKILKVRQLADNVREYVIEAPEVARAAKPGQFVILRLDEDGERVPFTICDMDKEAGTITLLIQTVGYTTMKMEELNAGDVILDFVGPLGNATDLDEFNNILLVGGGIGAAVIYPQAKELMKKGKPADVIVGARTKSLIMYEEEFKRNSKNLYIMTDDGSYSEKGFVTDKIKELVEADNSYDVVFAVGPLVMMRAVSNLTKQYNIHTIVSMNSIMVDGTGMCGGCRVTVGGKTKYACVDGPEFDGHQVDFDEALNRSGFFKEQESKHICRLRKV
ncbi:MAG: sulfide/dihydroorotate dehydrogenase-like FAD/NAD-binding protein [Christensenellales bacterium]|jgi:ferredoxin--NADP+ reductase